jgi:hypothetical protein
MMTSTLPFGLVPVNRSGRCDGASAGYRLDVIAADLADAVRSAGGWLYDRQAAGWQVNLWLPTVSDERAVRILGLRACGPPSAADTDLGGAAVAVGAAAFTADAGIRGLLLNALEHRRTEVTLWGDNWPPPVGRRLVVVPHALSAAARAFKIQALMALGVCGTGADPTATVLRAPGSRTSA